MQNAWSAVYHNEVRSDLEGMGRINASRALKLIESQLLTDPVNVGASAAPAIAGCRLLKTGDFHVLYQLDIKKHEVYVVAVRQESGVAGNISSQKQKTHLDKVGF